MQIKIQRGFPFPSRSESNCAAKSSGSPGLPPLEGWRGAGGGHISREIEIGPTRLSGHPSPDAKGTGGFGKRTEANHTSHLCSTFCWPRHVKGRGISEGELSVCTARKPGSPEQPHPPSPVGSCACPPACCLLLGLYLCPDLPCRDGNEDLIGSLLRALIRALPGVKTSFSRAFPGMPTAISHQTTTKGRPFIHQFPVWRSSIRSLGRPG